MSKSVDWDILKTHFTFDNIVGNFVHTRTWQSELTTPYLLYNLLLLCINDALRKPCSKIFYYKM